MFLEMVETVPDVDAIVARVATELIAFLSAEDQQHRIPDALEGILLVAYDQEGSRFTMQPLIGGVHEPIMFLSCVTFGLTSIALAMEQYHEDARENYVVTLPAHADAVFSFNCGAEEHRRTFWFAIVRDFERDRELGQEMALHALQSLDPGVTVRNTPPR